MKSKVKQLTPDGYTRPMYVAGAPGIGKTAIVYALAAFLNCPVITWIAATMDPTDTKFPALVTLPDGTVELKWLTPKELSQPGRFILFLDELPNAAQSVLNSLQNLVWTRKLGEFTLSKDCIIIAAGNRTTDRAGAGRLNTAMGSRFLKVTMVADVDDLRAWGAQPKNPNDPKGPSRLHHIVLAFLKFRPTYLNSFDPKKDSFCCPRTLEFVSDCIYENEARIQAGETIDREITRADYENAGEDFAAEFVPFESLYTTAISPDTILRNPTGARIPESPDAKWATTTALAWAATANNLDLVLTYLDRLEVEYSTAAVTVLETRHPELANSKELTAWNVKMDRLVAA
jgi:hypothetical protein